MVNLKTTQERLEEYAERRIMWHFNKVEKATTFSQLDSEKEEFREWYTPFSKYIKKMIGFKELDYNILENPELITLTNSLLTANLSYHNTGELAIFN